MYLVHYSCYKHIGYMWRGIKTNPIPKNSTAPGPRPPPPFEIPGSVTENCSETNSKNRFLTTSPCFDFQRYPLKIWWLLFNSRIAFQVNKIPGLKSNLTSFSREDFAIFSPWRRTWSLIWSWANLISRSIPLTKAALCQFVWLIDWLIVCLVFYAVSVIFSLKKSGHVVL